MSNRKKEQNPVRSVPVVANNKPPAPISRPRVPEPEDNNRPDFERNLALFRAEFFNFVAETDANFDLALLRNNPNPPVTIPSPETSGETFYPHSKEELALPLRLRGPRVIIGDIFAQQILLDGEIRVKGSVYGHSAVKIGASCVIEGNVTSGGPLEIGAGSRVQGVVIAENVWLNGPVQIEGLVYSRTDLIGQGRIEAQMLFAQHDLTLGGDPKTAEVRVGAGLIIAKTGKLSVSVPIWLTEVAVRPDQQTFYVGQDANGEPDLVRPTLATDMDGQPMILTVLSDADLEKLVTELANVEREGRGYDTF